MIKREALPILPVELRLCTPEDLDEICIIEETCYSDPWPRTVIERDLSDDSPYIYLCACAGGRTIGYGAVAKKRRTAELANLAVWPEYQRRGVASQLIIGLAEMAQGMGCRRMSLHVREFNDGARALYGLFGFVPVGRERKYYSDGEDAILMEVRLPLGIPKEDLSAP